MIKLHSCRYVGHWSIIVVTASTTESPLNSTIWCQAWWCYQWFNWASLSMFTFRFKCFILELNMEHGFSIRKIILAHFTFWIWQTEKTKLWDGLDFDSWRSEFSYGSLLATHSILILAKFSTCEHFKSWENVSANGNGPWVQVINWLKLGFNCTLVLLIPSKEHLNTFKRWSDIKESAPVPVELIKIRRLEGFLA